MLHKKPASYRKLSEDEKTCLVNNGCSAGTWDSVLVAEGFSAHTVHDTIFSGEVRLGVFSGSYTDGAGVEHLSGIRKARIHNCTIGSGAVICNIGDYIANYDIGEGVVIRNCGRIFTEGESAFGNGTLVAVMNETGGRAVKIWDRMSAHEAYIIALYRHRSRAVEAIEKMVDAYSGKRKSGRGVISTGSAVTGCSTIRNVYIGPSAVIEGAANLNEGSVNSTAADPARIGPGVIMEHFIMCSGSVVTESTLIDKCFIGQGCILAKHYSAENSLFFANCGGYHGEACSIFAGPYTLTHHKSTLLIAGIFSFMNAGSGSNQSNHMYKLGPIHQGIMERGSKTTSNSYLLWPARIGPFTLVMGRHYKNLDTTSLPFSYLIESNDQSILVPAINLRSVGTIRDAQKWPGRDRRKDSFRIDQVNFNLLSPYTIRKMFDGRNLLMKLRSGVPGGSETYRYNNMVITAQSLERGIELYQTGINKFLGNSMIKRLENMQFRSNEEIRDRLRPGALPGKGEWVDLAGLIVPKSEVDRLLDDVEQGRFSSVDDFSLTFAAMHGMYYEWEWTWVCERLEEETGIAVSEVTAADVTGVAERWKKSVVELDKLLYEDARKEFALSSMTGFGIDGSEEDKKRDFEKVRGEFESNSVVAAIRDHISQKTALGDELISRMQKVKG